jgi:hypothetical protein
MLFLQLIISVLQHQCTLFQLKESISEAFESIMKDEELVVWIKAKDRVLQVIQAFVSNCIESQDTLKLTSSEEGSCKPADQSGSTEKLPSEDVPDGKFAYPCFVIFYVFFCLVCFLLQLFGPCSCR